MALDLNTICCTGRLGTAPELRYTQDGTAVTNFRLAVNRMKRRGEEQSTADWFTVVVWGRSAETSAQYLDVGAQVAVNGRVKIAEWTDRNDQPRTTVEIHTREVIFINTRDQEGGNREGGGQQSGGGDTRRRAPAPPPENDDWLPDDDEEDPFGDS